MKLELIRTYYPNGTNGQILLNGDKVCLAIELPWKNNVSQISCIPEGEYELRKRSSQKFGWHFELMNVPCREYILIHPANDAILELKGCIAPVSFLTGEGRGTQSRMALQKLKEKLYPVLEKNEKIFLTIQSDHHENDK